MTISRQLKENSSVRLLLAGTILFAFYYIADCALDSLLFGEESFSEQLLNPSLHEVAIRTLSGTFLFIFFIIAVTLLNKNRTLQAEIQEQSQVILAKNKELAAYNFALSHELGTSVTGIIVTKDILKKKCAKCSDGVCGGLLDHMYTGCEKLSSQINGMLNFSEANRLSIARKPVSIDNIAREIAKEIAAYSEGEALDIQIDNKIETECDPDLIQIALKNLIDNAVKFRSPERHGEIEIGMVPQAVIPTYYIRDNGLGFDPADSDRLFRPFERLSNSRNIPGNGVGLATANTIIERHGGRLWAEGSINEGATFYFTLSPSTSH